MTNPVLVEVVRGAAIESRHRGAVAIYDTEGAEYLAIGDVANPIFPQVGGQAVPGAAAGRVRGRRRLRTERQGTGDRMRVPRRRGRARRRRRRVSWRARVSTAARSNAAPIGRCTRRPRGRWRATTTRPRPCITIAPASMRRCCVWRASWGSITGTTSAPSIRCSGRSGRRLKVRSIVPLDTYGIDGCSIPTYAVPLSNLARAFARFGTGRHLGAQRYAAARRLMTCCGEHPFYLGGTDRFCTGGSWRPAKPRLCQNRRRRRYRRRAAGTRSRHRGQMRRWRAARRRSRHGCSASCDCCRSRLKKARSWSRAFARR